jgi:hypothetical protein
MWNTRYLRVLLCKPGQISGDGPQRLPVGTLLFARRQRGQSLVGYYVLCVATRYHDLKLLLGEALDALRGCQRAPERDW